MLMCDDHIVTIPCDEHQGKQQTDSVRARKHGTTLWLLKRVSPGRWEIYKENKAYSGGILPTPSAKHH